MGEAGERRVCAFGRWLAECHRFTMSRHLDRDLKEDMLYERRGVEHGGMGGWGIGCSFAGATGKRHGFVRRASASELMVVSRFYFVPSNSTSKMSVAFGGIAPG